MSKQQRQEQPLSKEEADRLAELALAQAKRVFAKLPLLGPVTWLLMQHGATRHALISDVEWRVMPALIADQAKLYLRDGAPMAFVSWALLSETVAARYREEPHRLAPADWHSGDQIWIVDLLTPFGGAQDVLTDLREKVFPGKVLHQLAPFPDGPAKVLEWR